MEAVRKSYIGDTTERELQDGTPPPDSTALRSVVETGDEHGV